MKRKYFNKQKKTIKESTMKKKNADKAKYINISFIYFWNYF